MRLARTFWDKDKAQMISAWLLDRGVEFELQPYPHETPVSWRLWILDQDKLAAVCQWVDEIEGGKILLEDISKDPILAASTLPSSPVLSQEPIAPQVQKIKTSLSSTQGAWFTQATIIILIVIHLSLHMIAAAPVAAYWKDALLMDNPSLSEQEALSPLSSNRHTQVKLWPGLYRIALNEFSSEKEKKSEAPTRFSWDFLSSVREGEIWRLVTPAFLHGDWIHLLFNVLWLSLLGTAIEPRLGSGKMAFLMLVSAIASNLAQYVMSGYNFLGFSGVVMALVAFAYVRIKQFPWEGYRLSLSTFTFIGFYLILTLCLQLMSFILDAFALRSIFLNTANTAHLSGLFVGWLLGQMRSMAIRR